MTNQITKRQIERHVPKMDKEVMQYGKLSLWLSVPASVFFGVSLPLSFGFTLWSIEGLAGAMLFTSAIEFLFIFWTMYKIQEIQAQLIATETITETTEPAPTPQLTVNNKQIPAHLPDAHLSNGFALTGKQRDTLRLDAASNDSISGERLKAGRFFGTWSQSKYVTMRGGLVKDGYLVQVGNSNSYRWTDKAVEL